MGKSFPALIFIGLMAASAFAAEPKAEPSQISSLQIKDIPKDSIFERLGLQNGDFLKSVNGKPLTSQKQLDELTEQLSGGSGKIKMQIIRQGKPIELVYKIKGRP
jgi:type II secretory pathway component PulC